MRVARRVLVSGRVQGVAFRWYTQEKALSLGLDGWVRNLRSGDVEAWLEADEADLALAAMLEWLAEGPRFARVDRHQVFVAEPTPVTGFEVRSSA
jgi:acylphosphatase